jgi:hypothetical protein
MSVMMETILMNYIVEDWKSSFVSKDGSGIPFLFQFKAYGILKNSSWIYNSNHFSRFNDPKIDLYRESFADHDIGYTAAYDWCVNHYGKNWDNWGAKLIQINTNKRMFSPGFGTITSVDYKCEFYFTTLDQATQFKLMFG